MSEEPKIEPKWEDDVPYCCEACRSRCRDYCLIDGEPRYTCPHAIKGMAEKIRELEAYVKRLKAKLEREEDRMRAQRDVTARAEGQGWSKGHAEGWAAGVTAFAWWKDGVQYVGTCGTTLKDALAEGDTT